MSIQKIANQIKTGLVKESASVKKAVKKIAKQMDMPQKIHSDLDKAAALGKSMVKKVDVSGAQKTIEKKSNEVTTSISTVGALKNNSSSEQINKVEQFFDTAPLSKKNQTKQIAKKIVNRYEDVTPADAVKGAMELVNSTGVQSGKSAELSAKVFGTEKTLLEKKLDMADLKAELKAKQAKKLARAQTEKASKEAEFKNSFFGKMQQVDEVAEKYFN